MKTCPMADIIEVFPMNFNKTQAIPFYVFLALMAVTFLSGCEDPRKIPTGAHITINDPDFPVLGVEVRAVFDQERIAMNFRWESSKNFAGQFRNLIAYDGGKWSRVSEHENMEEDRLTVMFEDPRSPVKGFANTGCYISCHSDMNEMPKNTGDSRHYVLAEDDADVDTFGLDLWHWRGARSGPMGYAEDTYVSKGTFQAEYAGCKRDELNTPPTDWIRDRGDRLREDQPLHVGRWKGYGLPRFVFNPEKVTFGNYFLADEEGILVKSREQLMAIESMDYMSMKVVYQDYEFDPDDKVNAIDVLYLLYIAGTVDRPHFKP